MKEKEKGVALEAARAVKSRALSLFSGLGEVNGVGITRVGNGYGLKVNLSAPPREAVSLPDEIDGVPIVVEVVGRITKRPAQAKKSA